MRWCTSLLLLRCVAKSRNFPLHSIDSSTCGKCCSSSSSHYLEIVSTENKTRCHSMLTPRDAVGLKKMPWMKDLNRLKRSAVLVPLCLNNGHASILFTHRSSSLRSHRGQVSFPGGMQDEGDSSFVQTAIRETQEEIGLSPDGIDVWGQLDPTPGRNFNIAVVPVIGFCGELKPDILEVNQTEVQDVFTMTLQELCDPANRHYTTFTTGSSYTLPVFLGSKERIWGLTAIILHRTLQVVAPQFYKTNLTLGR